MSSCRVSRALDGRLSSEEARVARLINADKRMRQTRAEPVPDRKHRKKKKNYTAAAGTALTGGLLTAPYASAAAREDARMRRSQADADHHLKRANGFTTEVNNDSFDRITNAEAANRAGREAKAYKRFRNTRLKQVALGAGLTGLAAAGMHKIQNAG